MVEVERLSDHLPGALRLCHSVVSLKEHTGIDFWPGKSVSAYREDAYRVLKAHKIVGGAVVIHPFRKDDYDAEFTLDGYVHFHCVGFNFEDIPEGGQDVDSEGDLVVFKHIPDSEYGDFRGFRSQLAIEREIQYLLSHAGVAENVHSLTYFGELAPCKLSADAIELVFPESMTKGSKVDPKGLGPEDPVSGSHDTEPCYQTDLCRMPSLKVPDRSNFPLYDPDDRVLAFKSLEHPEPDVPGTPEVLEERREAILEEIAFEYETEPDYEVRKAILKKKRTLLRQLDRDESVWLNFNDPFVRLWAGVYALLSSGLERLDGSVWRSLSLGELADLLVVEPIAGVLDPLATLVGWNIQSGRLEEVPGDCLRLRREYDLERALADMRGMLEGESSGDWRLERLLRANPSEDLWVLSDTGFVFGDVLSLLQYQGASE